MTREEIAKIQNYLRKTLQSPNIKITAREKKDDSAEVYIEDEFLGVIFKDIEDGELSYNFSMAILEIDMEA